MRAAGDLCALPGRIGIGIGVFLNRWPSTPVLGGSETSAPKPTTPVLGGGPETSGPKPATEHTKKANVAFAKTLPFNDTRDFDNAKKGLIAELPDGGVVKNAKGEIIFDPRKYDFIKQGKLPREQPCAATAKEC